MNKSQQDPGRPKARKNPNANPRAVSETIKPVKIKTRDTTRVTPEVIPLTAFIFEYVKKSNREIDNIEKRNDIQR
jgi:hypothetical protein